MTRILFTLEYPPDVGGVAEYYRGLVDALPMGEVRVITPRDVGFFTRWIWPHWLPLLWNAWRIIRREKPDEVWVGQILPIGTALWLIKKLRVTRSMLRVTMFTHGMDILTCQQSRWKAALARRILASTDRVIANSNFTKGVLQRMGVHDEKIRVIYPCPRVSREQENSKTQEQLIDRYQLRGKKILLTTARLVRRKGVDLVLEALRDVVQKIPNLVYVIVGDGPEREELKVKCHMLNVKCLFVGPVSDAERNAWYELCDVFIMTPRQIGNDVEGFGLVYLEAALHSKPVIGSRSGGVSEAIVDGETGLVVDEEDVGGIASAITTLFTNDALYQRLAENGLERVHKKFQWQHQIRQLA